MDIFENLIQVIHDAEKEAFDKEILTNAIVLNKKHDYTKAFVFENTIVPSMILGKQVIVADLPDKYSFALIKIKEPTGIKELYEIIKQKRDNAQKDIEVEPNSIEYNFSEKYLKLRGRVSAYNDVLSLIESMFEVRQMNENKLSPTKKQLDFINIICLVLDIDKPKINSRDEAKDFISNHIEEYKKESSTRFYNYDNERLNG